MSLLEVEKTNKGKNSPWTKKINMKLAGKEKDRRRYFILL